MFIEDEKISKILFNMVQSTIRDTFLGCWSGAPSLSDLSRLGGVAMFCITTLICSCWFLTRLG